MAVAGTVLGDGTKAIALYYTGDYRTMLYINTNGTGRATLEKKDCHGEWGTLEPIIDEPKTAKEIIEMLVKENLPAEGSDA